MLCVRTRHGGTQPTTAEISVTPIYSVYKPGIWGCSQLLSKHELVAKPLYILRANQVYGGVANYHKLVKQLCTLRANQVYGAQLTSIERELVAKPSHTLCKNQVSRGVANYHEKQCNPCILCIRTRYMGLQLTSIETRINGKTPIYSVCEPGIWRCSQLSQKLVKQLCTLRANQVYGGVADFYLA